MPSFVERIEEELQKMEDAGVEKVTTLYVQELDDDGNPTGQSVVIKDTEELKKLGEQGYWANLPQGRKLQVKSGQGADGGHQDIGVERCPENEPVLVPADDEQKEEKVAESGEKEREKTCSELFAELGIGS